MTLLFKYRPPIDFSGTVRCNTARIFSNSALYFAKPSTFNDPLDGQGFMLTAVDRFWCRLEQSLLIDPLNGLPNPRSLWDAPKARSVSVSRSPENGDGRW